MTIARRILNASWKLRAFSDGLPKVVYPAVSGTTFFVKDLGVQVFIQSCFKICGGIFCRKSSSAVNPRIWLVLLHLLCGVLDWAFR